MEEVGDKKAFESRYRFIKAIGDGGQGGVYRYEDMHTQQHVVVKEYGQIDGREWRMLRAIRHPHICTLVDRMRYENRKVKVTKIVVESMDTSVQAYLMRGEKRNTLDRQRDRLPMGATREIFYCTALALAYLHRKLVVHLDVKLDNLLLKLGPGEAEGGRREIARDAQGRLCVKLADFGLAFHLGGGDAFDGGAAAEADGAVTTGKRFKAAGTNGYIAPEVESDTRYGVKADVFGLGVALHVMLTGAFPTSTGFKQQARIREQDIEDQEVRDLLLGMLDGDPCRRPYMHDVLDHPWLATLRTPGDLDLGDLTDAEKDGKLLLLQLQRPRGGPPLGLYVDYLDLADLHDPSAAVVVCACPSALQRTVRGDPTTLGAVMAREEEAAASMPTLTFQQAFQLQDTAAPGLKRVVRRSGEPLRHVKSLWTALVEERSGLKKETLWRVHKNLREACQEVVGDTGSGGLEGGGSGRGTVLYVCMTSGDDIITGFRHMKAQRQFVVHELVSLAQFLAQEVEPWPRLEAVVIYTWRKESLAVLMELLQGLRDDCHGIVSATRDDLSCCVSSSSLLAQALACCPPAIANDPGLTQLITRIESASCPREVCSLCAAAAHHIRTNHGLPHHAAPHQAAGGPQHEGGTGEGGGCCPMEESREEDEHDEQGSQGMMMDVCPTATDSNNTSLSKEVEELEAALDMLHYNGSKAAWDSSSIEPSSSSLVLLGSYDALLSLRALGTVITTLGRAAAGSGEE